MSNHHSQTLLPAEQCIEALIVAGGNTHLAAERLFGTDPNATALLTASIAQDPLALESLNAQLRTLTTLQAFDAMHQARNLLPMAISELEPKDFVRYYTQLVTTMREFTEPVATPTAPGDSLVKLLNLLPPEARRAFLTLAGRDLPALGDGEPLELGNDAADSHEPHPTTSEGCAVPSEDGGDVERDSRPAGSDAA